MSADFRDDLSTGDAEILIELLEERMKALSLAISSIYIRPEKPEGVIIV